MAGLDDILKQLPIDDIASKLGVDRSTAQAAVLEGGQTILAGLQKETESPEGKAALSRALNKHAGPKQVSSIADIDTEDGHGILRHVFGGEQDTVASRLGAASSTGGGIDFGKLLPMLAPIIMNYVANRKNAGGSAASDDDGPDLGDVLGGLLGGGSGKGIDLGPRRRRRPTAPPPAGGRTARRGSCRARCRRGSGRPRGASP